jgi:hypothetical protein
MAIALAVTFCAVAARRDYAASPARVCQRDAAWGRIAVCVCLFRARSSLDACSDRRSAAACVFPDAIEQDGLVCAGMGRLPACSLYLFAAENRRGVGVGASHGRRLDLGYDLPSEVWACILPDQRTHVWPSRGGAGLPFRVFHLTALTYFCQINVVRAVTGCPYAEQLGVIMQNEYRFGNFNASLFASEGIASLGWLAPIGAYVRHRHWPYQCNRCQAFPGDSCGLEWRSRADAHECPAVDGSADRWRSAAVRPMGHCAARAIGRRLSRSA